MAANRKLKLLIGLLCFVLGLSSAFASETEFTAKVQAVLPNGTMRCKIVKFLRIDPDELKDVKRGNKYVTHVDVNFNEVSLPDSAHFRARAVALMRRLCVGHKVSVSVGGPHWAQGKVIADVEIVGSSEPTLQLVLVKRGLASYKSDGGQTDDVISDAEESASARHVGMWAKPHR